MPSILEFPNQSRAEVIEQSAEKWYRAQVELLKASEALLAAVEFAIVTGSPVNGINCNLLLRVRRAISEAR